MHVQIRNREVLSEFNREDGRWLALRLTRGGAGSVLRRNGCPFDLMVDGSLLLGDQRRAESVESIADGRGVRFVFVQAGLRIAHEAILDEHDPVLRQSVGIEVFAGPARKMTAVHYEVPGFCVGDPADCLLQAPGQVVPPDADYARWATLPLDRAATEPLPSYPQGWLESCPDQSSGLVAVENRRLCLIASTWLHDDKATAFPTLDGQDDSITVGYRHQLALWLKTGAAVVATGPCTLLTVGGLEEHLAAFRRIAYAGRLAVPADRPDWVRDIRLLQINPRPLRDWSARLPRIAGMGFNLLYLMPVWECGNSSCYALTDHYHVDPAVGTEAELQAFVAAAHAAGLRVIFDFIPQGLGCGHPGVQQHPHWLVRDDQGRPFGSHGWGPQPGAAPMPGGTYSADWGLPEYQDFIIEWAAWNVRTFGIDGFRTDAMHWKEPNFDPANPRPAWQTMFGGVRLMERLRPALKAISPNLFLLSEVWGPIFDCAHDAAYLNGWLLGRLNEAWFKGEPVMSARQWQRHLALARAVRPDGAVRALFTANHDLMHVVAAARTSPLTDAVSFMHVFSDGFPFVTWGEVEEREPFFTDLMMQRAALRGYACSHSASVAADEGVFTALWTRLDGPPVLAVANVSASPVSTIVSLPYAPRGIRILRGSPGASVRPAGGGVAVELSAGGYALAET